MDHVPGVEEVGHSELIPPPDVLETLFREVVSCSHLLQISSPSIRINQEPDSHEHTQQCQSQTLQQYLTNIFFFKVKIVLRLSVFQSVSLSKENVSLSHSLGVYVKFECERGLTFVDLRRQF